MLFDANDLWLTYQMEPITAIEEINSPESSDTLNCTIDKISLQNVVVAKHDPNSHFSFHFTNEVIPENSRAPEDANGFLYCAKNVFHLLEMQLDIYSDIYFNLLYCKNKNNYIPICLPEWSDEEPVEHRREIYKSKKELFDSFSKNYKRNSKRQDYYQVPFNPKKKSEILNVAPNVSRLLVLSTKFCNVLRKVDGKDRKEYNFSYSDILTLSKDWSLSLQEDDMWLLAQLV